MRVYSGSEDQLPDALLEAIEGVAAPAYRGLAAYIVIEDLELAAYGNRVSRSSVLKLSELRRVRKLMRQTRCMALFEV